MRWDHGRAVFADGRTGAVWGDPLAEATSNARGQAQATSHERTATRAVDLRWWALGGAIVLFAVFVWGGYAMGWRWTGLSDSVTLWDWLEALALPVAVASTPLLLRHRRRLGRRHRAAMAAGLTAFAALVFAGYVVPMSWTGFTGNTLWDWLELLLLPLAVATASLWAASFGQLRRQHVATGAVVGAAFVVLVVLGYLEPLTWTGFTGNTAWDWLKLLLLPLLVPIVLLPLVTRQLTDRLAPPEDGNA